MAAALLFSLVTPSRYEAFGLMEVSSRAIDGSPFSTHSLMVPNDSMVLSQAELLKSPAVLQLTAKRLQLSYPELLHAVTVAPIGRSLIIKVTATAHDPKHAQIIANDVMQSYQDHQRALKSTQLEQTTHWLNEHVTSLATQMRQSAQAAAAYRKHYNLDDGNATRQQIADLTGQFVKAQMDLTVAQATQALPAQNENDKALTQQLSSPVLIALAQQETMLRQKIADLEHKYGTLHPDRQAAQAEFIALHAKQAQEIKRLTKSLHQDEQIAAQKIDKLHKQFDQLQNKNHQDNEQSIQLQALDDDANINRILYENFLQRSKEADLSSDFAALDAQIVSEAGLPLHKSNPNPLLLMLLGGLAGLFIALATIIVSEQFAIPLEPETK